MRKYRDKNGDLKYTCWKCKCDFNFKAMYYIEHNKGSCPNCDAKIKLQQVEAVDAFMFMAYELE